MFLVHNEHIHPGALGQVQHAPRVLLTPVLSTPSLLTPLPVSLLREELSPCFLLPVSVFTQVSHVEEAVHMEAVCLVYFILWSQGAATLLPLTKFTLLYGCIVLHSV